MKKIHLKYIFPVFIIFIIFFISSCTTDDTVTIESVKVESADKIRVYYTGSPEDPYRTFDFSVDIVYEGVKTVNYTTGYLLSYSSFHDYVDVSLRKSIPKGATVTVKPSSFSEKLYGSATYIYED